MEIDLAGPSKFWKLVKFIPESMAGFKITDDELSGQEIYGNKDKVDKAWSVKFDHLTYDKFKF